MLVSQHPAGRGAPSFIATAHRDLEGKPINRDQIEYLEPPVWRRWYVVGPAAVGLAVVTRIVVSLIVREPLDTPCKRVGGGACR